MQINKMLKVRSQALKTAVEDYNKIAKRLGREQVRPENVLSYVYLSQFELLRLSRHKILEKPWAGSLARNASTAYHKLLRSEEEIKRLNIEVLRLTAYIRDHHTNVERILIELHESGPDLAHQLEKWHHYRKQQDLYHLSRLKSTEYVCNTIPSLDGLGIVHAESHESHDDGEESGTDIDAHEIVDSTMEVLSRLDA